jgi:transcription termination factor NusA
MTRTSSPAPIPNRCKKRKKKKKAAKEKVSLEELSGVGEKTVASLKEAGFNSVEDIAKAIAEELTQVKGIGEKKAEKLIEEAKKLTGK